MSAPVVRLKRVAVLSAYVGESDEANPSTQREGEHGGSSEGCLGHPEHTRVQRVGTGLHRPEASGLGENEGSDNILGGARGVEVVADQIRHCRVSKMFSSSVKRLEVSCPLAQTVVYFNPQVQETVPEKVEELTPAWAWVQILAVIKKSKNFKALEGLAPAGDLARKVQEYIDGCEKD